MATLAQDHNPNLRSHSSSSARSVTSIESFSYNNGSLQVENKREATSEPPNNISTSLNHSRNTLPHNPLNHCKRNAVYNSKQSSLSIKPRHYYSTTDSTLPLIGNYRNRRRLKLQTVCTSKCLSSTHNIIDCTASERDICYVNIRDDSCKTLQSTTPSRSFDLKTNSIFSDRIEICNLFCSSSLYRHKESQKLDDVDILSNCDKSGNAADMSNEPNLSENKDNTEFYNVRNQENNFKFVGNSRSVFSPKYVIWHWLKILLTVTLLSTVVIATPIMPSKTVSSNNSNVSVISHYVNNVTQPKGNNLAPPVDILEWIELNGLHEKLAKTLGIDPTNLTGERNDIAAILLQNDIEEEEEPLHPEQWFTVPPLRQINDDELEDFDKAITLPPTQAEQSRINQFSPSKLNYTAIRIIIDSELDTLTRRSGRSYPTDSETVEIPRERRNSGARLPRLLSNLGRMFDFETVINEIETSIMTSVSCNACKGGVSLLQTYIESGKTKDDIVRAASKLCTNFKIETPRVCFGIIHLMSDEVVYVLQHLTMTPDSICGFLIGDVCGAPPDPSHQWRVLFPPYPKPPVPFPKPPTDGVPSFKVLHLSDTHFDPYYLEGSNAECGEPMCCRATSGKPKNAAARAGRWGDYRKCDTPLRTIESMFKNIRQNHPDVDYIIWTGDLPPHDIWNQTHDSNLLVLRETVQQLLDYFPNVPVFPALGNHESAPVNSFPPPTIPKEHSAQWLYDELEVQWRRWLPAYTANTIRKGGFYSVEVATGFRIISLNMNFCNNKNWWLLLDSQDPANMLQWLVYELQTAELQGEKVHIIGHIPPGYHDCLKIWSHNFYNIVNRYESTITAQFYGHTHYDEFEIFYDDVTNSSAAVLPRPTNVAYVAPSITTYLALNPAYRFYHIEAPPNNSLYRVIDHETWVMNLDEANHPGQSHLEPRWYPLYSARRAYGMRSLLPVDWDNLVYRMVDDEKLFDKFYRFYWKNSPMRPDCDSECRKRILCDLKSGRSNARKTTCAVVHERVEAQERSYWRHWLFSGLTVTYVWVREKIAGLF